MTAAEHLLYGTVRSDDGAVTFNHTDVIQGAEDVAAISAITVYTSKISQPEGDEDIIVDVAFEYSVGSSLREAGPFHPAAGSALSNTFGLPGSNITEVVGAFSPRGLTFICFKTNKRTHMYGKAVESSRGGSSFSIVVPANQRLLGLRGQVGRADADVGDGGPVAAIQNVAPVFADLPYLDTVKVSAATMGGKKDESKTKEKNRRKLTRVSGRSANSSLVSSIGSQQSSDAAKSPSADTSARSQLPEGKSSKKKGFVTVARWWKHPLGNEIEGEFVGDRVNGRATFTWHNGDRFLSVPVSVSVLPLPLPLPLFAL